MRQWKLGCDNSAVTLLDWSAGALKRDRKEETVLTDEQSFEAQVAQGPNYTHTLLNQFSGCTVVLKHILTAQNHDNRATQKPVMV